MSRCLYCGAELRSSNSHFCPGHHLSYRRDQLNIWDMSQEGSEARQVAGRNLRRFPGWWDYDNNEPTRPARRGSSSRSTVREAAPVVARTYDPIEYKFRKFGIELETVSPSEKVLKDAVDMVRASGLSIRDTHYTHSTTAYWKVLTDASLHGGFCREVVSPAFTSEAGFNEVYNLASTFTTMGVKVNNSCGFHCHLDVADLVPKQVARILQFYRVYEAEIDKLHQSSRRGNAQYYTGTLNNTKFRAIDPEQVNSMNDILSHFNGDHDRYYKVNVQAYLRHGTIEFRQHGATIDPVKIINWVKFCTRIVEYAKSDRPIDSSIPLFDALNLSEAEKIYWNHRKEVLAA